jgi:hypothetical protein
MVAESGDKKRAFPAAHPKIAPRWRAWIPFTFKRNVRSTSPLFRSPNDPSLFFVATVTRAEVLSFYQGWMDSLKSSEKSLSLGKGISFFADFLVKR